MKLAGESIVKDYGRRNGLKYTIIRPSAVYGEFDVSDRVVGKFMLTALRNGVLKVNGADETLDFTYSVDAADGIVRAALSSSAADRTYNITKSHSTSLLDAAKLAIEIAGSGSIECVDKDQDFPSRGALDISAARRDFGYNPQIDVDEGFRRYHRWLTTSQYWSKKLNK
jgi:nucleoside-diphosphate-sugar epimerase